MARMMDEVTVQLDWTDARDVVAQPANVVLVQGLRGEVVLSLGHAPPPIAMAALDEEGVREFVKNNPVKVQQIARITLPVHVAAGLAQTIADLLSAPEEEAASGASGEDGGSS